MLASHQPVWTSFKINVAYVVKLWLLLLDYMGTASAHLDYSLLILGTLKIILSTVMLDLAFWPGLAL